MNKYELDLIEEKICREARKDFYVFRQFLGGEYFVKSWLHRDICYKLTQFYDKLMKGERPKMILSMPPQHGKSFAVYDFISWVFGKNPNFRIMYTSASDSLCKRANRAQRRTFLDPKYKRIFHDYTTQDRDIQFNFDLIELNGYRGSFRTATCGGTIVGETLDLGVIDDPVKGREAANSANQREIIFNWFTNDFYTRFSRDAGFIMILTRWHVDDLAGRLIDHFGDSIEVIKYKAIAEQDEEHRKAGEALFPELKPLSFLEERRSIMQAKGKNGEWASLYQQEPFLIGGNVIKSTWFQSVSRPHRILHSYIFADTAQKIKERNDFTVFQHWGKGDDGKIYLLHQLRGKFEAPELKRRAKAFWQECNKSQYVTDDAPIRALMIEDKSSGTGLIQELKEEAQIPVVGIQREKDKYTRLLDILSYIEAGYVCILEGADYVSAFLSECEEFTPDDSHAHDDQIDCLIDAVKTMLASSANLKVWENLI